MSLMRGIAQYGASCEPVTQIVRCNIRDWVQQYMEFIEKDLRSTDALPGTSDSDQLSYYNRLFVRNKLQYVLSNIPRKPDQCRPYDGPLYNYDQTHNGVGPMHQSIVRENEPVIYSYSDGVAAGRAPSEDINEQLERMKQPHRGYQLREDPHGGRGEGQSRVGVTADYTVADMSRVGLHTDERFWTPLMDQFAAQSQEYEDTQFGIPTEAATARLLSRRYRDGTRKIEMQARMHNRALERDIGETLQTTEYGYQQRGYGDTTLADFLSFRSSHVRP